MPRYSTYAPTDWGGGVERLNLDFKFICIIILIVGMQAKRFTDYSQNYDSNRKNYVK